MEIIKILKIKVTGKNKKNCEEAFEMIKSMVEVETEEITAKTRRESHEKL